MLGDLITAGAKAVTNFASVLVDGNEHFQAGADLQKFGNVKSNAGAITLLSFVPVLTERPAHSGSASKLILCLLTVDADSFAQDRKEVEFDHPVDPQTNQRANVAKQAVSEAAAKPDIAQRP